MLHFHVAPALHATGINALIARSDFFSEVVCPALAAESVLAVQTVAVCFINFRVADLAVASVLVGQARVHVGISLR